MTIEELHAEMRAGFEKFENRFEASDASFATFRAEIKREMSEMKREMRLEMRLEMRRELKRHEDALRTHFDVMVERMQESVKIVAEATAHHAVRLDGHETRIKRLESPRRR